MSLPDPVTSMPDQRLRWREVRFTPLFLAGALLLHAGALWIAWKTVLPEREEETYSITMLQLEHAPANEVSLAHVPPPPPTYALDPPPPPELAVPLTEVPTLIEPSAEPPVPGIESEWPDSGGPGHGEGPSGPGIIGLGSGAGGGGGGHGGGHRSGLASSQVPLVVMDVGDSEFKKFVDDLRQRGLDLVFVVDATASMDKFIAQARSTIDEIIADVSAVVPDLRLGVVAYRDRPDAAITQSVQLTDDRYLIHNFLLDLQASGGGDFEEAVDEGLRVAIEGQPWRHGARRVLVLIGDAPPHTKDESKALALVRDFARDRHSVLSVLYTGVRPGVEPTDRDRATQRTLERLAHAANGLLSNLQAGEGDLCGSILDASFGLKWHDDIRALLAHPRDDWRRRIVKDKVAQGQRAWLAENLAREPVYPAVVDGCLELFDATLAQQAFAIVQNESLPTPVRSVALYLLKRKVAPEVALDVTAPLADQSARVATLQRAVSRFALVQSLSPPQAAPGKSPPPPGAAPAPGPPPKDG